MSQVKKTPVPPPPEKKPVKRTPVPPPEEPLTPQAYAAVRYGQLGYHIVPLHTIRNGACSCGKSDCHSPGKHPLTRNGLKDATTDVEQIREWWTKTPDANIAMVMGEISGLVALDMDPRHGGFDSLFELEQKHNDPFFRQTWNAATGGGGVHFLFQHPGPGVKVKSRAGALGPGLDVKGDGGYIVVAPSRHLSGEPYRWSSFGHDSPAPIPGRLLPLITDNPPERTAGTESPQPSGRTILHGQRNVRLTTLAGTMQRKNMSREAILAALLEENARHCQEPLPSTEVERIVASVSQYPPAEEAPLTGRVPFVLQTAAQLLSRPPEEHRWLVENHLRLGGSSQFIGLPRAGKSVAQRNLVISVLHGEPFLGFPTRQGPVFYLLLDYENIDEVQDHFRRLGLRPDDPLTWFNGQAPDDVLDQVERAVMRDRPLLIVVDPLFKLIRNVPRIGEYTQVSRALEGLIALARESGAHLNVSHHAPKPGPVAVDMTALGSISIEGATDRTYYFKRAKGYRTLTSDYPRYGTPLEEQVLRLGVETGRVFFDGAVYVAVAREIAAVVDRSPEALTEKALYGEVKGDFNIFYKALQHAIRERSVLRGGRGVKGQPYLYMTRPEQEPSRREISLPISRGGP